MGVPDILPNCLTRIPKVDRNFTPGGQWFYLFCANCGADGGRVMDTMLPAQYAFYLCNECAEKYGEPYGFAATPDDVWRAKVADAMQEEYGHCLTEFEVLQKLNNPSSALSKLEKEGLRR
jgi:hypothetical protein